MSLEDVSLFVGGHAILSDGFASILQGPSGGRIHDSLFDLMNITYYLNLTIDKITNK